MLVGQLRIETFLCNFFTDSRYLTKSGRIRLRPAVDHALKLFNVASDISNKSFLEARSDCAWRASRMAMLTRQTMLEADK